MSGDPQYRRPLSPEILKELFDHQRWVRSGGRFGRQFDSARLPTICFEFEDADLDGVDLKAAILDGVRFYGGSARGACFARADLDAAIFQDCDVAEADFTDAHLVSTSFINASHSTARFDGAVMSRTAWNMEEAERYQREQKQTDEEELKRAERGELSGEQNRIEEPWTPTLG